MPRKARRALQLPRAHPSRAALQALACPLRPRPARCAPALQDSSIFVVEDAPTCSLGNAPGKRGLKSGPAEADFGKMAALNLPPVLLVGGELGYWGGTGRGRATRMVRRAWCDVHGARIVVLWVGGGRWALAGG